MSSRHVHVQRSQGKEREALEKVQEARGVKLSSAVVAFEVK